MAKQNILTVLKDCKDEVEGTFLNLKKFEKPNQTDVVDISLYHLIRAYNLGRKEPYEKKKR